MFATRRLPLVFALFLAACGGGGGDAGYTGGAVAPTPVTPPAPMRGSLVQAVALAPIVVKGFSVSKLDPTVFATLLNAALPGTTDVTGSPTCAITTYTVKYNTVGSNAEATDASAAIMVPSGADPQCSGSRPVMLYAHATAVAKSNNMADLASNTEAQLVAAIFAAQGYIVVAPNYTGYAGSSLPYHPYLDANAQANDMVDALRAARSSFAGIGTVDAGKLFIAGYSQGGYVAVATQRAIEQRFATEFTLSAVSGMSGPYALSQLSDSTFNGSPRLGVTAFMPLLIEAAQHASAAVYSVPGDAFEAPYASTIETLLPSASTQEQLIAAGKLPASHLFAGNSLPQASGYGDYFGDGNLLKTSFRNAYLSDLTAHPCNANAADPLNCAPLNNLRKWMVKNDLRGFTPLAPLMLCGGDGDPTVPYLNTQSAAAYFSAAGMPASKLTVVDLDTIPGLSDPYRTPKLSFVAAKVALGANALKSGNSPEQTIQSNYHAGLVAPFCMRATRDYFQGWLNH